MFKERVPASQERSCESLGEPLFFKAQNKSQATAYKIITKAA